MRWVVGAGVVVLVLLVARRSVVGQVLWWPVRRLGRIVRGGFRQVTSGRRLLFLVPIVCLCVGIVVLVARGDDAWVEEDAEAAADLFEGHCAAADRLAEAGELEAASEQLVSALTAFQPAEADPSAAEACAQARERIAAAAAAAAAAEGEPVPPDQATGGPPVSVPAPELADVPVEAAIARGLAAYADGVLEQLGDAPEDRSFELEGWDWVVVGVLALLALSAWSHLYFWITSRRRELPTAVTELADGSDESVKNLAVRLTARMRREVEEGGVPPPSAPNSTIGEELPKLVEAVQVSGSTVVVALLRIVQTLFGSERTFEVSGTVLSTTSATVEITRRPDGGVRRVVAVSSDDAADDEEERELAANAAAAVLNVVREEGGVLPVWQRLTVPAQLSWERGQRHEQAAAQESSA